MATDSDETNKSDNNTSMSENDIKYWLDAYDKIYKDFELASSHYFIRTQIIMFAIQIVLGTGFGKLVSDISSPICTQKLVLLLAIPIIGSFFACAWLLFIKRQWNSMEFYRCYMRYIEKKLINCKVPLALFRAESAIFHWEKIIDFIDSNEVKSFPEDNHCLQTEFPYFGKRVKSNNLMGTEGIIACFILLIWSACFIAILSMHWNIFILPCLLPYIFIAIFILVFAYWIVLRNLWEKLKECYRNRKRFLFSIDPKFQSDLDNCKPSKELKDEFNNKGIKKGIKLSDNPSISIEEKDRKWVITDENKGYTVRKRKGKLNIYRKENKEIKFWDLKKDDFSK